MVGAAELAILENDQSNGEHGTPRATPNMLPSPTRREADNPPHVKYFALFNTPRFVLYCSHHLYPQMRSVVQHISSLRPGGLPIGASTRRRWDRWNIGDTAGAGNIAHLDGWAKGALPGSTLVA